MELTGTLTAMQKHLVALRLHKSSTVQRIIQPEKKILFTTIWHTGTQYMLKEIKKERGGVHHCHCSQACLDFIDSGEFSDIRTTYRDPLRTAASWGNRGKLLKEYKGRSCWEIQWDAYKEVLTHSPYIYQVEDFTGAKVNSAADVLGLHKALDEGDMETYYKIVPKELIQYTT
jgi:hypothetical protein